jgi:hypothetical protein
MPIHSHSVKDASAPVGASRRFSTRDRRAAELLRQRRWRYARRLHKLGEVAGYELIEHFIQRFELDPSAVDRLLDHVVDEFDSDGGRP